MLPPLVQWLIIVNVAAFLLQNLLGAALYSWFALWPGDVTGTFLMAPWTLVSYSFLHAGLTHLLLNMFALWMFGADLERVWGTARFALCYFLGVVVGALAQIVVVAFFGAADAPVIGASAGVFALLAGYGVAATRRPAAPGVYLAQPDGSAGAKIASLGIKISRGCSYHGVALNVAMDLEPFSRIDPCGYPGLAVTDLRQCTGDAEPDVAAVAAAFGRVLAGHIESKT